MMTAQERFKRDRERWFLDNQEINGDWEPGVGDEIQTFSGNNLIITAVIRSRASGHMLLLGGILYNPPPGYEIRNYDDVHWTINVDEARLVEKRPE